LKSSLNIITVIKSLKAEGGAWKMHTSFCRKTSSEETT